MIAAGRRFVFVQVCVGGVVVVWVEVVVNSGADAGAGDYDVECSVGGVFDCGLECLRLGLVGCNICFGEDNTIQLFLVSGRASCGGHEGVANVLMARLLQLLCKLSAGFLLDVCDCDICP